MTDLNVSLAQCEDMVEQTLAEHNRLVAGQLRAIMHAAKRFGLTPEPGLSKHTMITTIDAQIENVCTGLLKQPKEDKS